MTTQDTAIEQAERARDAAMEKVRHWWNATGQQRDVTASLAWQEYLAAFAALDAIRDVR